MADRYERHISLSPIASKEAVRDLLTVTPATKTAQKRPIKKAKNERIAAKAEEVKP